MRPLRSLQVEVGTWATIAEVRRSDVEGGAWGSKGRIDGSHADGMNEPRDQEEDMTLDLLTSGKSD